MDYSRFDRLTRLLGTANSRRDAMQVLAVAITAGLSPLLARHDARAGKKGKGKGKGKKKCDQGQTRCGKVCADLQSNDQHCSSCDNDCSARGLHCCSGTCVDTLTDHNNCNGCNGFCREDEFCSNAKCVRHCPPGQTKCGDRCIDLTSDRDNCNGCGQPCGEHELCQSSVCICPTSIKCPLPPAPDGTVNHRCCPAAGGTCCTTGKCCGPGSTCSGTVCIFPN